MTNDYYDKRSIGVACLPCLHSYLKLALPVKSHCWTDRQIPSFVLTVDLLSIALLTIGLIHVDLLPPHPIFTKYYFPRNL